jgi:hypothetical protein
MEVKELIRLQEGDGIIRLLRQGLFLRGYNAGAVMLERIMGYKVYSMQVKAAGGLVCYAGFPSEILEKVLEKAEAAGGRIVCRDDRLVEIGGLSYDCGEDVIASYPLKESSRRNSRGKTAGKKAEQSLIEAVVAFDLINATPVQAVLFVGELKRLAGTAEMQPALRPGND